MAIAIPVLNTLETEVSTEAPATASFWTRAKARVINIAKRVASPIATASRTTAKAVKSTAVKTASTIKRTAIKVASATKRAAKAVVAKVRGAKSDVPSEGRLWRVRRAADSALTKARTWLADAWTRAVKPFLKLRAVVFALFIGAIAFLTSPLMALTVGLSIGAGLWGLSYLVEYLEASAAPSARFALKTIEFIAQTVKALVYIATAALTIALCATSFVFAVTEVLELVLRYFNVREAVGFSTMTFFALSGQWTLFVLSWSLVLVRSLRADTARQRTVETQSVNAKLAELLDRRSAVSVAKGWDKVATAGGSIPHADEPRAFVFSPEAKVEGPRRVKLPKCSACGIDDGGARFGLRDHKNLCGECFDKLDHEDTVQAAKDGRLTKSDVDQARKHGLKVPKQVAQMVNNRPVNQRKDLTLAEIEKLSPVANSRDDASKVYWAETAWWYDRDGRPHTREWLGFVDGHTVASVEYLHEKRNRGFEAWLLGATKDDDRKVGLFHTLDKENGAQDAIANALSNQRILIGGMLDALQEEVPAPAPAPVEEAHVLTFQEADIFASPEEHIEHVRKTIGDAAASALEEHYLQTMLAAEKS